MRVQGPRPALRAEAPQVAQELLLRALALGGVDEEQRAFREALERAHASAATVLTFALGHEQLPPYYSFAARPGSRLSISSYLPSSSPPARLAAAATSLEDLITQALEPVA